MGVLIKYELESVKIADQLGGLNGNRNSPHNDEYDAFRHARMSAIFADKFGCLGDILGLMLLSGLVIAVKDLMIQMASTRE
jgi:hypothetical protein